MRKNTIIESAQQTADKLIVELQHTYPGVTFTLKAYELLDLPNDDVPYILVTWSDGPTSHEVYKTVRPYESMEDGRVESPCGYYIRDQHYIGAYYVELDRTVSPERKEVIMDYLRSFGHTEKTVCLFQMDLTEIKLIAAGKLPGY